MNKDLEDKLNAITSPEALLIVVKDMRDKDMNIGQLKAFLGLIVILKGILEIDEIINEE